MTYVYVYSKYSFLDRGIEYVINLIFLATYQGPHW